MTPQPGRPDEAAHCEQCPRLAPGDAFGFACRGCGDCCRGRRDLVLSGVDLYRLARWMRLPPRAVAGAFCKAYPAPGSGLPTLRLTPDPKTGNCRFLEGSGCAVHPARPLACALYPLGQAIDPQTAAVEYYVQLPLCAPADQSGRTLRDYLQGAGILARGGDDLAWAVQCTKLAERLQAAAHHRNLAAAQHRCERALYYDYALGEEFYPQFADNMQTLHAVLDRLLA